MGKCHCNNASVCTTTFSIMTLEYNLVKSLFGLRRSLFNTVHRMADPDSSLGPAFIASNITRSAEILSLTFFYKNVFPSKVLTSDKISAPVSFSFKHFLRLPTATDDIPAATDILSSVKMRQLNLPQCRVLLF